VVDDPPSQARAPGRAEQGGRPGVEDAKAAVAGTPASPARYRVRRAPARPRAVKVLYGEDELATVGRAAARAGLRPSSYVAAAALASAQGAEPPPSQSESRELLTELMQTRAAVRRYGTNLNQIAAAMTRESPSRRCGWWRRSPARSGPRPGSTRPRACWPVGWPELVIGQVLARGFGVRGLLYYLFTEGLAGAKGLESDHTDARVIASWDGRPDSVQPGLGVSGKRDFTELADRLNEPVAALGYSRQELRTIKPVYHLAVAAAKDPETGAPLDRTLTDAEWADIAQEYMDRIGLARREDDLGVRWVAVRHAQDHVHIVATLARQDGRRPRLSNDRYRSMEASRFVEQKYGLVATAATGRTGAARASRGEQRKHRDTTRRRDAQGRPAPAVTDREQLRRQVRVAAAGASGQSQFFDRLRADGLLVRERMSELNPGEVTGYAVALPDRYGTGAAPVFFGGGKLASDLTLPRLQRRWDGRGAAAGAQVGPAAAAARRAASGTAAGSRGRSVRTDRFGLTQLERLRIWKQATLAAARASEHIAASVASDPSGAADAAWAASDFLAAAGRVVEGRKGGPLTEAAQTYDQAARELHGKIPAPTAAGTGLRAAGRLLLAAQVAQPSETEQLLALMAQLSALTDAVTRLREAQDRAGQARAARQAAEALRGVTARYAGPSVSLVGAAASVPSRSSVDGRAAEPDRSYGPGPVQPGQAPSGSRGPRR